MKRSSCTVIRSTAPSGRSGRSSFFNKELDVGGGSSARGLRGSRSTQPCNKPLNRCLGVRYHCAVLFHSPSLCVLPPQPEDSWWSVCVGNGAAVNQSSLIAMNTLENNEAGTSFQPGEAAHANVLAF